MNRLARMMTAAVLAGVAMAPAATVTLQQGSNGYAGCTDAAMWDPGTPWGVYEHSDKYLLVEIN